MGQAIEIRFTVERTDLQDITYDDIKTLLRLIREGIKVWPTISGAPIGIVSDDIDWESHY